MRKLLLILLMHATLEVPHKVVVSPVNRYHIHHSREREIAAAAAHLSRLEA